MLCVCFGIIWRRRLLMVVSCHPLLKLPLLKKILLLNSCYKKQIMSRHQQLQTALADYCRGRGVGWGEPWWDAQ